MGQRTDVSAENLFNLSWLNFYNGVFVGLPEKPHLTTVSLQSTKWFRAKICFWSAAPPWTIQTPSGHPGQATSLSLESKLNTEKQRSAFMPHTSRTKSRRTADQQRLSVLLNQNRRLCHCLQQLLAFTPLLLISFIFYFLFQTLNAFCHVMIFMKCCYALWIPLLLILATQINQPCPSVSTVNSNETSVTN